MPVTIVERQRRARVDRRRLAKTAARALAAVGRPAGEIDLVLVGDAEIRRLNAEHRGVHRRTDVLAFPLEVAGAPRPLVGAVVVSVDAAARQAGRLGVPLGLELDLLVTHGVLHAIGWDDRDPVEAGLMHARARDILAASGRRVPSRLWRGLLA